MNDKIISIVIVGLGKEAEYLKKLFKILENEEFERFEIEVIYDEEPSVQSLERIVEIEKQFGKDKRCVISNLITCDVIKSRILLERLNRYGMRISMPIQKEVDLKKIGKYGKKLKKLNIPFEVKIAHPIELETAKEICNKLSTYKVAVNFHYIISDEYKLIEWFDEVVRNNDYINNNYFIDCMGRVLMNVEGKRCFYNSCLGKNIHVGEEGKLSFCRYHVEESRIGTLDEVKCYEDILSNNTFIRILLDNIDRRERCYLECNKESVCKGGCPMKEIYNCKTDSYLALYEYIHNYIQKIINKESLEGVNSYVKKQILNSIAFGARCER